MAAAAAAGGHIQRLRDEATCSICLDYFKDPVTIPECGHNFCRSCLIQYWGESEAEASCPQCRERVQRRSLIPNRQLANFVEIAQNLCVQGGNEEERKGGVCEDHQEPLKLFCKVHEAPICVVCDKSKEHENHKVIPLKEAFEEYKGEICRRLEILRKEREEILAYQTDLDKESKDLLKLTETERLKTVEKFKKLHQFLEEQEKHLLNHVEEVEKEIAGRRDEQLARLSRKLFSLEKIIQEMEETSQQPASELLQDVRSTLQRYEKRESPEKPLAFPPELRNRILDSCDLNHLVEHTMKQWKANVTLDPDTAHRELILSKDRKSEPRKIRVTLDYEGRRVSFSNADSGAKLYTFSGASFSGETLIPFFYLDDIETPLMKLNSRFWLEGAMAAAAGGHIQRLRDEATCSICLDYFKDPVTSPECGHNFCRSCLIQCWGESEAEASCPQCRKRVQRRSLIPNRQLANMVEIAQNLSLQEGKEEGGEGGVCEDHQEPLKLFCKVHEAPICLVCDKSNEHENHKVIPLKEAFEEYKGEICRRLEILRKEREEILAYQADLEKESKDLLVGVSVVTREGTRIKLTKTERLKTVEKFKELRQFLEEEEKRLLNHVEEVEKEIAGRRDEQQARLSRKLSSLENIIREMEEMSQQPASELLQDVRRTLQRYEKRESPEKPLAFPPELKSRILDSCDLNHLVEDTMKQWKDALLFRKLIQKANVTLDPDTAHPQLILSKDRKSVRRGDKEQDLPDNPERFNYRPYVLGCEGFTAGRHFWEVSVESGEWWAVGVARKSVERKGFFPLNTEEGIWAVEKSVGEYWACTSPDDSLLSLSGEPRRIRVTLAYEGGRVSFSDADSGAELYTFSGASFSGETLLPFFYLCRNKTHLSIS
ncbi:E3 ubiquitin-protein ligase TRIM11-like [Lacerta agilis]|uniref:E3 ubiquitin-protein ligase TRIM11-like n=1 Tax=Lacerta agilis TaxID=80427 RepID=UPI001419E134|nr:E3 ubiquitin-protein ligase TRIM11-like [Lacerta agilis]